MLETLRIPGYELTEVVREGANNIICRAIWQPDRQPVILKILKEEYPTLEQITRIKHEYKIAENLEAAGIVKIYRLETYQNRLALVCEDFGGQSLKQLQEGEKLSLISFLGIAVQLVQALASLHQQQIIHKDIKPANIIINTANGIVKITDFSVASRLSKETPQLSNPNSLEGTLAYMSPEQTGRMNRAVDYRTDFYSLGVTFYEMLTGELPFKNNDFLELVHCHIAKQPVAIEELNPEVPCAIASLIAKLMAKNAEDRYQSAAGLLADLEYCLVQLKTNGKITNFIPGQLDCSAQLLIPQKLYGREQEVEELLAAFERVAGEEDALRRGRGDAEIESKSEMMLVSGYSGIGKSSLVNEVHKPIVRQRGYFISGKFDQFKRNIPYASLIQAFQSLIGQLLTEDAASLQAWRDKLLAALGSNGQVIIDVIPEVELIIGKQPEVPQLGATESQNRFNRVFPQFIGVFTQKEHPLVIFLDDLQWADAASLKLMQLLITAPESQYLLLIGAYRDNEVNATHPLMQTVEEIQKAGTIVNNIVVKPLNLTHVHQIIDDALNETDKVKTQELASLLFNKTAGNPFFLTQILKTLERENLLTFDFVKGCWEWDIKKIQAFGINDLSVVELIARNICQLPQGTQEILKLAACIGDRFKLDVLATTSEKSAAEVARDLWSALQQGLILPLSNNYKIPLLFGWEELQRFSFDDSRLEYRFLHDRVQQAAYSLIPDSQKKAAHLQIGQLLLKNTEPNQIEDNIFDIVNQLNIGIEFIERQSEKNQLAQLNAIAGKKAKASNAYEAAVKYLNLGLELLAPDSWRCQYDLTLELYVETTDAEYLNTNFDRANQLSTIVLSQAKNLLEKVPVYQTKIQFYIAQNQMQLAIDTGLEVLQMLGYSLNAEPPSLLTIEQLLNLPEMQDPYQLAALRILNQMINPAFIAAPHILQQIVLTMVNLSIQYGNSSLAAIGYVFYGMILSGFMGDFDGGYQFGKLAERILDKFPNIELESRVQAPVNVVIRHWKEHIRETLIPLMDAAQTGLIAGNLEFAAICSKDRCTHLVLIGEDLEHVDAQFINSLNLLREIKQEYSLYYAKIWRQLVLNLMGRVEDKYRLIGESFDEVEMLPYLVKTNNLTSVFSAYLAKGILGYLFKDYVESVENFELAARYVETAVGFATVGTLNFYQSLAMLALYPTVETGARTQILQQVQANQEKMQQWAYHAPMNYQHKYQLIEAEKARVLSNKIEAIDYYDQAIKAAAENGYIQEEALAYELAGEFYESLGKEIIAQAYMTKAYYYYIRWGALAKVKDLESRYPYLVTRTKETTSKDITVTTTSTTVGNAFSLDISTVAKASQALSSEIVLDRLLEKLMHLVAENAGAEKVFFIAKTDNQLVIEATLSGERQVTVLQSLPISECDNIPRTLINYVARTQTPLVLDDATEVEQFNRDAYIVANQPKSILVSPILHQGNLTGILYLENNITRAAFTRDRLKVLGVLSAQAAISLENARFYNTLETRVTQRTQELQTAIEELRCTQLRLIQTEKMSSLGQLVGGMAHEINNPINFIYGNLQHANDYAQDLLELLSLYQKHYANPIPEIVEKAEEIELEFIKKDFTKILGSMESGAERLRDLVLSLRNFSRLDESARKTVNIHQGMDSTLTILHKKLGDIKVIKEYGKLPLVNCYAGEVNQVFMNILSNAIDALDRGVGSKVDSTQVPTIRICTELRERNQVAIHIADNGVGISSEVVDKIFDPFFTTKPVGKGTGLGLSISYQIVVEQHGGQLLCQSAPGEGTQFTIVLPIAL
ncbi:AAA family ATPase [Microseira sp. BLCC-F43]|uniref:trifunctional serine/threonine-protein kinase/ATP-binding protein/sensor histidine kinase n=1 Tax=Microseira sp. BLCC-F43 TaxID=3153602 RepID=UPI0035B833D3